MSKKMVYFNATKQIETITIHYNSKLDGVFVDDVCFHIKDIAKKMGSKVNLKDPKDFYEIQVFVYPDKKMFNSIFGSEIEKRVYKRKTSDEDLYVVKDSEGNIHIVSPRGMSVDKKDSLKKILVMKVLGEYMDEKENKNAQRLLKIAMQPKKEEVEQDEEELEEPVEEEIEDEGIEKNEEELEEEQEVETEGIEEPDEELEEVQDERDEKEDELTEEELNELIAAEVVIEQIDSKEEKKKIEDKKEEISKSKQESRNWLDIGWFMFVKGKLKKQEDVKKFAGYVSENGVKKLGKLKNTRLLENYDYSPEYACALVAFVVETYGIKKYVEFYNEPKDIKKIFGVPKFVFDAQFKAYVKEKYKDEEKMQNIMEDKKLDEVVPEFKEIKEPEQEKGQVIQEITEIYFTKSGGAEINEPKLKNLDEPQIKM